MQLLLPFLHSLSKAIDYFCLCFIFDGSNNETLFFLDMEVTGLTPGKEYKFRVAAVNSEGESEPLEADQTIVAKNPFGKEICNISRFIL